MKLRIKYSVPKWIMGRFKGRVFYPWMLFLKSKEEVSDQLFRHELEHVYQFRRDGFFKYYLKYVWYHMTLHYDFNPYENQAYERQDIPLTDAERELR
jgi:hypothetical protein